MGEVLDRVWSEDNQQPTKNTVETNPSSNNTSEVLRRYDSQTRGVYLCRIHTSMMVAPRSVVVGKG